MPYEVVRLPRGLTAGEAAEWTLATDLADASEGIGVRINWLDELEGVLKLWRCWSPVDVDLVEAILNASKVWIDPTRRVGVRQTRGWE